MMELEQQIAEMPATSIAGMVAKARCAIRCARASDENCPDCDDPLSIFSASIVRDLLAMFRMNLTGA
jgi:hypothetical protein